jgi:mannose/fructose/N-acetylgalactosamine-specific phosphotransferase system component IID
VLPLISLAVRPEERQRPATALLALLGGPIAGAGATLFWHTAGPLPAIATSMAAVVAWTSSRRLQTPERWLWLLWLAIGVFLCWTTVWAWDDPDRLAWRVALFH